MCVCPDYLLRLEKELITRGSRCTFEVSLCKDWNYWQFQHILLYRLQHMNDAEFPQVTVTFRYILAAMWDVYHNHTIDFNCCAKLSSYVRPFEAVLSLSTIGLILVRSIVNLQAPETVIWISCTMEAIKNYVQNTFTTKVLLQTKILF